MLVVVASRHDRIAPALVARWAAHDAALLTCADLSVAGWRYAPGDPETSTAVVSGRTVGHQDIAGVLVRLPYIGELELPHIAPAERNYVAAEMTAFLLSWLSALGCPVLNRPTPVCLAGPYWRHAQWVYAAARLGIPVDGTGSQPYSPHGWVSEPSVNRIAVTVVGDRCFGAEDETLSLQAQRLAAAAGVELLTVHFRATAGEIQFFGAELVPDVSSPAIADHILARFLGEQRC